MKALFALTLGVAAAACGAAEAHIVFAQPKVAAGSHWAGALRVGHGCQGSATVAVRVEIPADLLTAKPQPKPGWTLEIEREPLAAPVKAENGALQRDRVRAVTWRGRLPDDQFDEFALAAKLPATAGILAFPVVQTCEQGEARWVETPAPGAHHQGPNPAPILTLTPAAQ